MAKPYEIISPKEMPAIHIPVCPTDLCKLTGILVDGSLNTSSLGQLKDFVPILSILGNSQISKAHFKNIWRESSVVWPNQLNRKVVARQCSMFEKFFKGSVCKVKLPSKNSV